MKHLATAAVLVCMALLTSACGDDGTSGPTAADYQAERERLVAKLARNKSGASGTAKPRVATPSPAEASELADVGFGAFVAEYTYDKKGKRDPFQTYRHDLAGGTPTTGPLLAYELEQLSVVAVVWATGNARALVADPRGETHVIKEGSPVGKNDGLVIHIGDNMVLVKETYVDFAGEMTTKDVELRVRGSQGG